MTFSCHHCALRSGTWECSQKAPVKALLGRCKTWPLLTLMWALNRSQVTKNLRIWT